MYSIPPYSLEKGSLTEFGVRWTVSKPHNPPVSVPPKSSIVVGLQYMGIFVFEMDAGNFNFDPHSFILTH